MFRTAAAAAFGLSVLAGPLYAQSDNAADPALEAGAENQVSVNIDTLDSDLRDQIAAALEGIDPATIPETVEVPPGIAAQVCVAEGEEAPDAATLAQGEDAECDATTTTQAFNNFVQKKMDAEAGLETEVEAGTEMGTETEMETETETESQ